VGIVGTLVGVEREAERIAREVFGVEGAATPLPGELDLNFRIGAGAVLKLHAVTADRSALELQDAVLAHLAGLGAPRLLGSSLVSVGGEQRVARLLSWIEGRPWAEVGASAARLEQLGAVVARTDRALAGFSHPAMRRALKWNLLTVPVELAGYVDGRRRQLVDEVFGALPSLDGLPEQVIHNDANELNVLVGPDGVVSGLIDFGDTVWSARVCGLAVAGAYAMQGLRDPVRDVLPLVRGYHGVTPLRADELAVLFALMRVRLAVSVCMSAWQYAKDPSNEYLLISQDAIVPLLERLSAEDPELAHFRLRDACGYEANPRARAVRNRLMAFPPEPLDVRVTGGYLEDGRVGVELADDAGEGVEERDGYWLIRAGRELRVATHPVFDVARVEEELDLWRSVFLDPALVLGSGDAVAPPQPDLLARRRTRMSAAMSLAYREPLHIVGGHGAQLVDADGGEWLDLVNNVAHVGHQHPHVVAAGQAQMARLNTNTRYLHDSVVEYARRLSATFPDPLNVCFFVNSGSEANDLALRLARTHTGREDVIVLDHAYHGHLSSLIALSPYKFNRSGGRGRPAGTFVAPLPDPYRGELGPDPQPYIDALPDCEPAAFFAESIQSCGGQIVYPPGYLSGAFEAARAKGAVCVADEVQVGFGRAGRAFWAFDPQGALPDIVTVGKPAGNGHPLAAVITTPEIAASFVTGMEYFNTFGGNPVSAEIGLAVLDVIERERLQAAARERGAQLLEGLRAIDHPLIGDVRGEGLFIGVELSLAGKAPATHAAAEVKEALKHERILISTDGPDDNVLKIKPPLVIGADDCERVISALRAALP
jgi:4-aminobutyrate aminotransferase-like enzyme/Ser/Thr protein kinase RdoA (MazF antagonist)